MRMQNVYQKLLKFNIECTYNMQHESWGKKFFVTANKVLVLKQKMLGMNSRWMKMQCDWKEEYYERIKNYKGNISFLHQRSMYLQLTDKLHFFFVFAGYEQLWNLIIEDFVLIPEKNLVKLLLCVFPFKLTMKQIKKCVDICLANLKKKLWNN